MKQLGFAKVGIIVMVLTSAVAAIGMGFGLWAQVLSIQGIVETGSVDAQFSNETYGVGYEIFDEAPFTNDDGRPNNPMKDPFDDNQGEIYDAWPEDSSRDPVEPGMLGSPAERSDKDVARCWVEKDEGETVLTVYVEDAYPSYWCTAWFHVRNRGSVPLKLQSAALLGGYYKNTGGGEWWEPINPSEWWCIDTEGISPPFRNTGGPDEPCEEKPTAPEPYNPAAYDLMIHLSELELGVQIDPTGPEPDPFDGAHVQGNVDIHVEQGAAQGAGEAGPPLFFDLEMLWVQWNEYVEGE